MSLGVSVTKIQDTGLDAPVEPERPFFLGRVSYDEDAANAMAWVVTIVVPLLAAAAWIFVGPRSGFAATLGAVAICLSIWRVRPLVLRLLVAALAFVVPLILVVIPQIVHSNRLAAQAEAARVAAEKPYTDAVAAAKTHLERQGFKVDKLSLDRGDMTRGTAEMRYHAQRGTSYAEVILIKKDDGTWTVNCPAEGGVIDITAEGNKLAIALQVTGACPAGLKKSSPATP